MLLRVLSFVGFVAVVSGQASVVRYMAQNLELTHSIVTNFGDIPGFSSYNASIALRNTGDTDIRTGDWNLFFCSVRLLEPQLQSPNSTAGIPIGDTGLLLYHINGCLHKLTPTPNFVGIPAGQSLDVPIVGEAWIVAESDTMPNWYVATEDGSAAETVAFTAGEELQHAGPFDTEEKWKRLEWDKYNPPTAEERYAEYPEGEGDAPNRIVPSPLSVQLDWSRAISTDSSWVIVSDASKTDSEAQYFKEQTGWQITGTAPNTKFVSLVLDENTDVFADTGCENNEAEAYSVVADVDSSSVVVTAKTNAGVFYGIQTCLSLLDLNQDKSFYSGNIVDCPRFSFRGFMLDTGRNFFGKEAVLNLLSDMAAYKLNRFHFHLSDDEGWRLQIDGLPELTEIASQRCHDLDETQCILPQLGSGPTSSTSGSGFYSTQDYTEILQHAAKLHIQVIPEFDMPGHAHAAIKAMEARYYNNMNTNPDKAREYLLSDLDDKSVYYSVQYFTDNSVNPCMPSTAAFLQKVIQELYNMHQAAGNPLQYYHYGGDEVASTAWMGSPICQQFMQDMGFTSNNDLKRFFLETLVNVTAVVDSNLVLGSWEDGVMNTTFTPFTLPPGANVYANSWQNVWEWGVGERAYILANADYKVVLSHATHLYFDHPHEPDPRERGYYWATRFASTEKTFGYIPDDIYANINVSRMGDPLTEEGVCKDGCVQLEQGKRTNVLGIQGQLWSETVRTQDWLEDSIFPRLLALAERAWHKAPWESVQDAGERDAQRREDWVQFAQLLGQHELSRLNRRFHLRPPGAQIQEKEGGDPELRVRTEFPGLEAQFRVDGGAWTTVRGWETVPGNSTVDVRVRNAPWVSEIVTLTAPPSSGASPCVGSPLTILLLCAVLVPVLKRLSSV